MRNYAQLTESFEYIFKNRYENNDENRLYYLNNHEKNLIFQGKNVLISKNRQNGI